jgi:hypothetical protein
MPSDGYEVAIMISRAASGPRQPAPPVPAVGTHEATTRQLERIVDKARRAGVVVIQEYQAA